MNVFSLLDVCVGLIVGRAPVPSFDTGYTTIAAVPMPVAPSALAVTPTGFAAPSASGRPIGADTTAVSATSAMTDTPAAPLIAAPGQPSANGNDYLQNLMNAVSGVS